MKNKILAILPSKVLYGKERSNIEVYNLLKKEGQEVVVLANNSRNENLNQALDALDVKSFNYPKRNRKSFRLVGYILDFVIANWKLRKIIKSENPDVLFFCTETSFYDLYFAIRKFKGKIIYRIGDAPAFRKLSFFKYNSWVWNSFVVKKVDIIVSISNYIKSTIIDVGRNSDKDIVIYNYPPTRLSSTNLKKPKIMLDKENDLNLIHFGFIGQILPQKGIYELILAANSLFDRDFRFKLFIAGGLESEPVYTKLLLNSVKNEYRDLIVFLDEVEDIETFFSGIDVLCVPSIKQEPLGNVLVEAKMFKTPCVIFPSGGMPELIQDRVDGFICKDQTVESLLEGMLYYLNNKDLIEKHSLSSYNSIEKLGINRVVFERKWKRVFGIN